MWTGAFEVNQEAWPTPDQTQSVWWGLRWCLAMIDTAWHCGDFDKRLLLWPPYGIGQDIILLPCDFYLLSSSIFFSSPDLSGRRLDVYHTSIHCVALVRLLDACLKCAALGSLKIQDAKIAILAPSHNFVGLSSQLRHVLTIGKNLLNIDTSSTCPHNMVNLAY